MMNYFLPTWNPEQWAWDSLEEDIDELHRTGNFKDRWSCSHSTLIKRGDRLFLMRLGQAGKKGICASGYAASGFFRDKHWNPSKNKLTNYVNIDFDVILNPDKDEILPLDTLLSIKPEKEQIWTPRFSGISINNEVGETLEAIWFKFLNDSKKLSYSFVTDEADNKSSGYYSEGASYITSLTKYERNWHARQKCLEHFGYKCRVCGFDFAKTYGAIGQGFIHVHHVTPLAEIGREYQLNPINDLRPVCPNCHAMIHRQRPALTIEELKKMLK